MNVACLSHPKGQIAELHSHQHGPVAISLIHRTGAGAFQSHPGTTGAVAIGAVADQASRAHGTTMDAAQVSVHPPLAADQAQALAVVGAQASADHGIAVAVAAAHRGVAAAVQASADHGTAVAVAAVHRGVVAAAQASAGHGIAVVAAAAHRGDGSRGPSFSGPW
jgi:hypothetical protein